MKTLIIGIITLLGFFALAWKFLAVKKEAVSAPDYAKRKAVFYLLTGLTLMIGITSVFADALFELLKLDKPAQFEWISLIAYVVFCIATVFIFQPKTPPTIQKPGGNVHIEGNVDKFVNKPKIKGDFKM